MDDALRLKLEHDWRSRPSTSGSRLRGRARRESTDPESGRTKSARVGGFFLTINGVGAFGELRQASVNSLHEP
ncbi:MAG: hypothetical protein AB1938_09310 [Myxococcota bacterium]